ncbi:MAG: hypothetical protein EZS28_003317 [Streblomastix strix]|uniref:Uncharacterized protein n=1 Tax=Streblomastix strix TaxID=222440 RepID=A0A5J4X326_9EUKA|nr:MAG: hypothetical protein EZS28_003317 [Streblomastix strix]
MLFIVLTVLLSFGYNIEQNHSEIIVPYLQDVLSTPPSQITKDENLIDNQIKSNLSYLPSKQHTSKEQTISNSENDQCKWTISDQYYTTDPTTGTSDKIDSAIRYCSDPEGYEIVLIDSKHNEDLNLDNDSPILIKGGNQKQTICISDGIGQDAYMNFTNLPTEWTIDNIEDKTKEMFNGSTSDAYESIYYEVYNNNSLFTSGNISIYDNPPPEPPKQKQKLSTGQIVGIVVGCISFVALIIVIIIISVLYYNKNQKKLSIEEYRRYLLFEKLKYSNACDHINDYEPNTRQCRFCAGITEKIQTPEYSPYKRRHVEKKDAKVGPEDDRHNKKRNKNKSKSKNQSRSRERSRLRHEQNKAKEQERVHQRQKINDELEQRRRD